MAGNPQDNAGLLDEQLQRAANTSVLSLKGVGRYLDENDDIIRVAVATDLAGACITYSSPRFTIGAPSIDSISPKSRIVFA